MSRSFVVVIWVLLFALSAPVLVNAAPRMQPVAVESHAVAAAPFDCNDLWASGFPNEATGLSYCLEHSRETIGGAEYRVVYPSEWASAAGWGTPYLDASTQALRDSIAAYRSLGVVSSATVVFVPKPSGDAPDAEADAGLVDYLSDEPCAITLYPLAELTVEQFKQDLAHELFHCFQHWNFPDQMQVDYGASGWWKDGSAEYFSNVVYPSTNWEWRRSGEFDAGSETTPLTQFTYAACFFFQHLGNTIGNAGIITLLGSLPTTGDEIDQRAALRGWPGMDALFQGFAQAYLDGSLTDTSGAAIPFSPAFTKTVASVSSGSFDITVAPFVVRRRQIVLDPSLSFAISVKVTSGTSLQAFRPDGGPWSPAPIELSCTDARTWYSAFTSVGEASDTSSTPAVLTVTISASEECDTNPSGETDSCLQGAWAVRDYEAFMVAALGLAGADTSAVPVTFEGASGSMAFTFDASTITYTASEFELRGSAVTQGITIQVVIRISGTATASYEVTEGAIDIVEVDASGFTITAESFLDGSSVGMMPMDPLDWIFFTSPTYGYTCSATTLELTIPPLAVPVVLER